MKKSSRKIRGFTVLELLILFALAAVVFGLAFSMAGGTRIRARDAKRKIDMKTIGVALNYYKDECPLAEKIIPLENAKIGTLSPMVYDPTGTSYQYWCGGERDIYKIYFNLENTNDEWLDLYASDNVKYNVMFSGFKK